MSFNTDTKVIVNNSHRYGDYSKFIQYQSVEFAEPVDNNCYSTRDDISILVNLTSIIDSEAFRIAFSVFQADETPVGTFFSEEIFSIKKGQTSEIILCMKDHQLAKGQYYLSLSVGVGDELTGITDYDIINQVLYFEILYTDSNKDKMITLWPSSLGSINFQNVHLQQL